jgi:hypothetical protein
MFKKASNMKEYYPLPLRERVAAQQRGEGLLSKNALSRPCGPPSPARGEEKNCIYTN